jgi:hypothetical protein
MIVRISDVSAKAAVRRCVAFSQDLSACGKSREHARHRFDREAEIIRNIDTSHREVYLVLTLLTVFHFEKKVDDAFLRTLLFLQHRNRHARPDMFGFSFRQGQRVLARIMQRRLADVAQIIDLA